MDTETRRGTAESTRAGGRTPGLRAELGAVIGFVERNWYLTKRYFGWELVFLVYNMVNTLTIALIATHVPGDRGRMVLYLVIGAILWGYLSVIFHDVSESVAWERWEGTIEYTFMAPIRRATHLFGMCAYAIVYGTVRSVIVLGAVALFFRLDLAGANLLGALAVLVVSSVAFIGLGLMAAVFPLLSTEKGAQATHIMEAVILLVSGAYYSVAELPKWLQPLSAVSPATYALRSIRAALLDGATFAQLLPDIALLTGIGVVLVPLGLWVFGQGERYAMRTGKLKRSG
ncbi:MAG: ABC transporter permease [Firmicutes bacterium]|nr:ABC transporter permease [Bacillota bacterium]